jgi:hypothetical protein
LTMPPSSTPPLAIPSSTRTKNDGMQTSGWFPFRTVSSTILSPYQPCNAGGASFH